MTPTDPTSPQGPDAVLPSSDPSPDLTAKPVADRRGRDLVGPAIRGVAVVGVGVLVVLGAARLPGGAAADGSSGSASIRVGGFVPTEFSARSATLPIGQNQRVCPGPETEGLRGSAVSSGTTTVVAAAAPSSVLAGVPALQAARAALASAGAGASAQPPAGPADSLTIAMQSGSGAPISADPTRRAAITAPVTGATSAIVTAAGAMAPGATAVQSWLHSDGDLRGYAVNTCPATGSDLWLVAGGPQATRRERLVLTNPGGNSVSVDVQVLGAKGPVSSPNGHGVSIPARGRTVLLLDALASGEADPVVHVTADGGEVSAVLNDAWIEGATARGSDDAVPTAPPATSQVIPAVFGGGPVTVRVANTAAQEAVVQTRVLTLSGPVPVGTDAVVRLAGNSSRDIAVTIPAGANAIQITADQPVVAGALMAGTPDAAGVADLAWSGAVAATSDLTGTALPGGTTNTLALTAGEATATAIVTIVGPDQRVSATPVTVAAASTVSIDVGGAASVWIAPSSGALYAGVRVVLNQPPPAAGAAPPPMLSGVLPLQPLPLTREERPVVVASR